ncbi:fatty acyl-CoA synthetase A-like [Dermatophagoides farinae]|uniref:fatty acyl-CoA synthetase A-like n=1 Tax=Dermatophagoides farinae TaxID=6954 RepID=UPI003F6229E0
MSQEHFCYSVPVDLKNYIASDGSETCAFRSPDAVSGFITAYPGFEAKNTWDVFCHTVNLYPNNLFLGKRKPPGPYEYITYSGGMKLIKVIGSALIKYRIINPKKPSVFPDEEYGPAQKFNALGLISINTVHWIILDLACHAYGIVSIPLYSTMGIPSLRFICFKTGLKSVCGSLEGIEKICEVLETWPKDEFKNCKLANVVMYGEYSIEEFREICERLIKYNIRLFTWDDLLDLNPRRLLDFTPPAPEAVGTISFTSGTTGDPKGVILTESAFAAQVLAVHIHQNSVNTFYLIPDFCYFSYLPLSHIFERIMLLICISFGMRIALISGKVDRLASDTQIAKPHLLCVVPRLLSTLYNKIEGMVETKDWVVRKLFYQALDTKIKRFRKTGAFEHFLWDKTMFKKIRDVLGGQLKYMLCGGALLERELQEKIACLFSIPVMQGYGSTETFGTTFCSISKDNNYGQVGGPLSVTEVKLVSVPDLEIQVNDEVMKGEAYIRGPLLFVGYFRNPKATKEAIKDGWYKTGDILIRDPVAGCFQVVDRASDCIKLNQGEFVVPETIETILINSPFIKNMLVHGQLSSNFLVAVIVLDHDEALKKWMSENKITCNDSEILSKHYNEIHKKIQQELNDYAAAAKLNGFEKVKKFILVDEDFSEDSDLLTPTQKLKRRKILQKYQNEIKALYSA